VGNGSKVVQVQPEIPTLLRAN